MNRKQASIVIMGVAGCGKSSLGFSVAQRLGLQLIEGDDHHSAGSLRKMRDGIALTDADRDGWLGTLSTRLSCQGSPVVLTCSALKRAYRERLRVAAPGLRFVYLDINRSQALDRVTARAAEHFFSTSLVDSQFEALEAPNGEEGVLRVDAMAPLTELQEQVCAWLGTPTTFKEPA
jgi:gluconokinase